MQTGIIPNRIFAFPRAWIHSLRLAAFRPAMALALTAAIVLAFAPAGTRAQILAGPHSHTQWSAPQPRQLDPQPRQLDPQPRQLDPQPRQLAAVAPAETADPSALSLLLEKGQQLESQHQWGEALSHYEQALDQHPDNPLLRRLHDLAKLHYGLEHRYHDRSFRRSITALTPRQALSLYSELLRKIDTHYVSRPPWRQLATRAVTALEIAISDSLFQQTNQVAQTHPAGTQPYRRSSARTGTSLEASQRERPQ